MALVASTAAYAGEEPLYQPVPDWVIAQDIDPETSRSNSPLVRIEQQARIEPGQLWTYAELALALDSPEALTRLGTLNAAWQPDKGDLIIHRVELLRDGEVIDLVEKGERFDVLRREQQLESRMLNGVLTATMPVTGGQIGDIVRLAYSVTTRDQALGEDVQWQTGLIAEPVPLREGRIRVSWPAALPVTHAVTGNEALGAPVRQGDYMVWEVQQPLAKPAEMPADAPLRYRLSPGMQVSTFADWAAVSRAMARHYDVSGSVAEGSALAGQIARIAAASDDDLTRAALALEVVQDQVSYLLNGLDGGNYLPQMPQETWEKRYGDCKAKSVLLLAMLQELAIEAEVVMVRTNGGDALPQLAPMPGNFDHMIVRAEIDGETYWLDGTLTGMRIDTIDTVPRFFHALPIREGGAGLMEMAERPLAQPQQVVDLTLDHSAGIRLPALFDLKLELRGSRGAPWRTVAEQSDGDQLENEVLRAASGLLGGVQLTQYAVDYDVASGLATVTAKGIMGSLWQRDRAIYSFDAPAQAARDIGFDSDRTRKEWRQIPLRLNGPIHFSSDFELILPEEEQGFTLDGQGEIERMIGGVALRSSGSLEGNRFKLSQNMRSILRELPVEEIAAAKRDLARFLRALPSLDSGRDVREPWEYFGKNRKLLAPLERAYALAVENAEADDISALVDRASFRSSVYDFAGALEDIETAIARESSPEMISWRAHFKRQLGDLEGALADLQEVESLDPNGSTYWEQIELLALLGRDSEALALAEEFEGLGESRMVEDIVLATAMGWAGDAQEGMDLLASQQATRPGDGTLLNSMCWHAGIWNIVNEERLALCTEAVEKADYSAAVLDSRALAYFRMGRLDEARADLDSALLLEPGLVASRMLRGIVRVQQGDSAGREDIELALAMEPYLAHTYKAWGLDF